MSENERGKAIDRERQAKGRRLQGILSVQENSKKQLCEDMNEPKMLETDRRDSPCSQTRETEMLTAQRPEEERRKKRRDESNLSAQGKSQTTAPSQVILSPHSQLQLKRQPFSSLYFSVIPFLFPSTSRPCSL